MSNKDMPPGSLGHGTELRTYLNAIAASFCGFPERNASSRSFQNFEQPRVQHFQNAADSIRLRSTVLLKAKTEGRLQDRRGIKGDGR